MKHKKNSIIFSIVVCTYNRENSIKMCLDSLIRLDFPKEKFEIIVVDDGSTDSTTDIVKKYPVRLLMHDKNQGLSVARNTGLSNAKGKIYVCFDDDCYVSSDWLKKLNNAYKKFSTDEIAGIGGIIKTTDKSGIIEKYMSESGYGNPSPLIYTKSTNVLSRFVSYLKNMFSPSIETKKMIFEVGEIWGANCSFPIKILRAVNGWDKNLSGVEDTDLCYRIRQKFPEKKFLCTKEATLYHDHKLTLKGLLFKPYTRGSAILNFYMKKGTIPPIFPFPLVIAISCLLITFINPLLLVVSVILLPQLFYSWWLLKAIRKRKPYLLIFPYLQSGYELFTVSGLIKGAIRKVKIVTPRKTLSLLIVFGILVNIFILKEIHLYYLRELISSLYLLLVPGLLISWAAKLTYRNAWEFVSYIVGLSIVTLMLLGLGLNYLFPYIYPLINLKATFLPPDQLMRPLTLLPILISLDIVLVTLWTYVFIRNNPIPVTKISVGLSKKSVLLGVFASSFPVLSIIGAFNLNNNQSNIFTMTLLGATGFFVVLLTILRNKVSKHLFPYSLFMIALSLLFMTSLRGWYITGHDIFLEYFIFQLTKAKEVWNMSNFQDPYNACLSITILPTIISRITQINDLYIYKALYQIIFAISIVATYLFIRKLLNPFLAFLATFSIVSLPTFMTDMPMLNRQEIALLFFVLLLNALFHKEFSKKVKWMLFILYGFGLLLSHYSTTYISMGLFLGAFLIHFPLRVAGIHTGIKNFINRVDSKLGLIDNKPNLHIGMILILLLAAFVWNVNITNTSQGISSTITKVFNDLKTSRFTKAKSDPAAYGLLSSKKPTPQSLLNSYIDTTTKYVRKFNADSAFLSKDAYSKELVTVGYEIKLPITTIGEKLERIHINPFKLNDQLKQLYAKIIQLFIVIGFFAIFFFKNHISNFEKEYLILTITFFGILVFQTILPGGSIDYGILRLFQQGMILFSVPLIMGGLAVFSIFDFIHKGIKTYLLSFIFIYFFLYLSGFIPTLTGGYYPQLNLSNAGFYYDAYYTHTQDKTAMDWLSKNRNVKTPIQSDWFALKKMHTYEQFYSIDGLIPSAIRINSYVYLSVSNLQTGQIIIYANGAPLYYKYNFTLLNDNKNLIYSNGGAKIYR